MADSGPPKLCFGVTSVEVQDFWLLIAPVAPQLSVQAFGVLVAKIIP